MGKGSFPEFLLNQWSRVYELGPQDLTGKNVLVVGANVGLGFEAAKHFAAMNPASISITCRSVKKAEDAVQGECPASLPSRPPFADLIKRRDSTRYRLQQGHKLHDGLVDILLRRRIFRNV
jgi:NAD(P)-dependent dehydrogenase (short-subunit alcohol dehydrogenase family)